jgi:pimeloyl-ACP methyl ester carboxylesterase
MVVKKRLLQVILLISLLSLSLHTEKMTAQPGIIKANGIKIAYESFGKTTDEAIIMIQGTGATMLHYPAEMCQKLAKKGFRVIRFDNRDIGLSENLDSLGQPDWAAIFPFIKKCDPAPLQYTLLDMAKDVTGLMDALKIEKAHIVGVSMGGAIAQIMAINFPERMLSLTSGSSSTGNPDMPVPKGKALTAMSTPAPKTTDRDSLANYLVGIYKALGGVDNDEVLKARALGHIARSWNPDAVNRQIAAVLIAENCDRRKDLAGIRIPTVVIHGDSDPLVTLEAGRQVAESIPGARFCIIKGMGHDLSLKFIDPIIDAMMLVLKSDQRNGH